VSGSHVLDFVGGRYSTEDVEQFESFHASCTIPVVSADFLCFGLRICSGCVLCLIF